MSTTNLSLGILKQLVEELLTRECIEISKKLGVLVKLVDHEERYTHVEISPNGKYILWHKHLYNRCEEHREQSRQQSRRIKELADKRAEIKIELETAVHKLVPEGKRFDKLKQAIINTILDGKGDALASCLGINPTEIPQINYEVITK